MLVGMSLVQGGSGLSFFAPSLFEYVSGRDVCNISPSIEEIPDVELQTTLGQVCVCRCPCKLCTCMWREGVCMCV